MTNWSIDILRQSGWDLWVLVCALVCLALVGYAVLARLWQSPSGWIALAMIGVGVGGSVCIIALPPLHQPLVGMVWTFILLGLLAGTFYLNLQPQLGWRRMGMLLGLRILALALLVPMFFEPVLRVVTKPKPVVPLSFIIDTSGSMSFPDIQNGPSRIESVWQTLRPQLAKVQEHFVPRYFTFATELTDLKTPQDLPKHPADGKATDIAGAIAKAVARGSGPHEAEGSIVLISDGIDNTSPNVVDLIRATQRKVHTVRVGSEQAEPATMANVAVDNVETTDDFVVNHETKVKITVKSTALANRVVEVKLSPIDEAGKPTGQLATKTLVLQPMPQGQIVEIPFKPKAVGVQRLAAWIDPIPGERSVVDNRQDFQGLALDPRIKVLYIEGRVRPEYTQLNRALSRDANIEVASVLRLTQDRFSAAGTVDGEPITQLPASLAEWKKFDVVIIGDTDVSFLNKIQQTGIEQFTLGGGGLLMVGGTNSFGPGGYKDSPIEKALPVMVGDLGSPQERSAFVPSLTPDGLAHPAMEGLADWFNRKKDDKNQLPPLRGNVVVPKAKNGASVLLTHADRPGPDGSPQIVLALQRYGQGRSAAFTADTTYLWYLPLRGLGQDSPYNRFWGQLTRWLAGEDVRNRSRGAGVDGLLNKSIYEMGQSVRLRAMVRDERGDATRYAQVHIKLTKEQGKEVAQYPLNPVESRAGLYDVTLPHPDKGQWKIELSASKDGKPLGKQEMNFTVIAPAEEMLKIAANPQLLAQISTQTGGFHFELAQLPNLIDQLVRTDRTVATARQETVPLANAPRVFLALVGIHPAWSSRYDLPMQALLIVALLAGEWILRRQWQLP